MLKKFATFMVLVTMFFAFQSSAWAAAIHADDTVATSAEQVISLEQNPQLALLNADLNVLPATGFNGMKVQPWFWLLSIPVPGLGQFLMGDMMKGLLFFFAPTILYAAFSVISGILVTGAVAGGAGGVAGLAGIMPTIGLAVYAIVLGIWVWNVWDAYMMNQAHTGMASVEDLKKQLAAVTKFMEENKLVSAHDGVALNHRLATF